MIHKIKYATISDICIHNIFFYDEKEEKQRVEFCKQYNISYLPSKDRKSVFRLSGDHFEKEELDLNLTLRPNDLIFAKDTIKTFENFDPNEIRFVIDCDGKIIGVFHLVDYNNEYLYIELYRALYCFEQNLRFLLICKKKTNDDFINWARDRSVTHKEEKEKEYWRKRVEDLKPDTHEKKREAANPFQTFYLSDLLYFCGSIKELDNVSQKVKTSTRDIIELRNWIMHSKDITTKGYKDNGAESNKILYNHTGLVKFVKSLDKFFEVYDIVDEARRELTGQKEKEGQSDRD